LVATVHSDGVDYIILNTRLSSTMAPTTSTSNSSEGTHLVVFIHGLWGKPIHLDHLRSTLASTHESRNLHLLLPKSNADYNTYDGIEVGAERITDEIESTIRSLASSSSSTSSSTSTSTSSPASAAGVTKISIVGYSLGGLIARYVVGLLYQNGIFDTITPINFTTFATPHLGVRTPSLGYRSRIWNSIGARTLSTSGQQMFLIDDFRGSGRCLLSLLADPGSVFMRGLARFEKRSLYANTQNDRSVPFYTAGISRTDPFVDLEKVDLHYLPFAEGEEEERVILDPENPVTLRTTHDTPPRTTLSTLGLALPSKATRESLPFFALFFTLVPIFVPFFLANSVLQTYRSAQRVRLHEADGAWRRFRIPVLEDAKERVVERVMEGSGEEQYLPTPPPERANESEIISSSSSSSSKSGSEMRGKSNGTSQTSLSSAPAAQLDSHALSRLESAKEASPFPILALTQEQFEMIDHLDALGFEKFPVHITKHRHTHAAIVVRTAKEGFGVGRATVRHWARGFVV